MEVRLWAGSLVSAPADGAVAFGYQGGEPGPGFAEVDAALGGLASRLRSSGAWKGEAHQVAVLHGQQPPFLSVALVGLGRVGERRGERLRSAAAAGLRALRDARVRRAAVAAEGGHDVAWLTEGAILGLYRFARYKTRPPEGELDEVLICGIGGPGAEAALSRARLLAEAQNQARDWANEPGSSLPPRLLAERSAEYAQARGLDVEVLDESALERLGAGAILGVARGSDEPPRLVVLRYRSGNPGAPLLALAGKGVCFDSGGLSLKTAEGMEDMKTDKSGACAVVAAMGAIGVLKPAIDVVGVCPLVENMTGGRAQKPGDVLRTLGGKTIEVLNTDAEGRLILADAVAYASRLGARWIVDVATLTGAAIIALGHEAAALVGNDENLLRAVQEAGSEAGERYWQLPAYEEYREQYRSEVADIKNTGGRPAGCITGGLIIGEFVGEGVAWAHLDIAGVASTDRDRPLHPKGATGYATRTLVHLAERLGRDVT